MIALVLKKFQIIMKKYIDVRNAEWKKDIKADETLLSSGFYHNI